MGGSGCFTLLIFTSVLFGGRILAQTLKMQMCADPVESTMCSIVCHTPDQTKTVAFYKLPDSGNAIAQCIPSLGCFNSTPPYYTIIQQNATATALQFELTRNITGPYRCSYGSNVTDETLEWGTYPKNVTVSGLTNGTEITSPVVFDVKLRCLYSKNNPTVRLHYEDQQGDVDAKSDVFSCSHSQDCLHDDDFTTYNCPCTLRHKAGIVCTDIYGVNGYIKVANIDTMWNTSIAENLSFKCTTTLPTTTTTSTTPTTKPNKCLYFIEAKSCVITYIIFGVLVICLLSTVGCLIKWKRNQKHGNPSNLDHGKKKIISETQEMHNKTNDA